MKITSLLLMSLLVVLAGCQRFAYQPPGEGPRATVVFSSDNIAVQPMVCVPGKGFQATAYALAQKPFESDFFNELNESLKKRESVTVEVPVDVPVRIGFSLNRPAPNGPRQRCKVAAQLPVQAGVVYQARFRMEGEHCGIQVSAPDNDLETDATLVPWECP